MKWNKRFEYPTSMRSMIGGKRHYDIDAGNKKLPSVTTILGQTQSKEKQESLSRWRDRVGINEATRITDTAAARGTAMHNILEAYVNGTKRIDLTPLGKQATVMADQIIKDGLNNRLSEVWGNEVTLYYPELYAGATDLVGVYDGVESIIDFKQSNKPKRREWIEDYFMQLGAYAMAHNMMFPRSSKIEKGVIMVCTPDLYYQEFVVEGPKLQHYYWKFLERLSQYLDQNKAKIRQEV